MQGLDLTPEPDAFRFSVLGPLSLEAGGTPVPLGPLKQRLVLALLLCRANSIVSTERLTETVWGDHPPRSARKNLQVYVAALRKILHAVGAGDRFEHALGGYSLRLAPGELDLLRFQQSVRAGRTAVAAGSTAAAARHLRRALELWRGPALADLRGSEILAAEAEHYDARYLHAYEDWAEAELALGNAAAVAENIGVLTERFPHRERLRAVQMRALYRLGRQSEGFAAYESLRQSLASDLGLQPSPVLQNLFRSMLAGEEAAPSPSAPPAAAAAVRSVLPRLPHDFVGREQQSAQLTRMLEREGAPVVVVTGPVGIGKTTFAVHSARRLADRWPGGVLFVRMRDEDGRPRTWPDVLAELDRLTGCTDGAVADPRVGAARWQAWFADRRALLVLDDAVDEASVRPLVPGGGKCAVLVTSRSRLAGLEAARRLDVPALAPEQARTLLARIIGEERAAGDPASVERIVAATGCVPLAVRVSGLKLSALRYLPLREFAARLADPATRLGELTAGDVAVRSAVEAAWRDLADEHRAVLRRLGSLPAPVFTLRDAAGVLGCGDDAACRLLESLIDAGALQSPDREVTSHAALYEVPLLAYAFLREAALAERGTAAV